jgi:hypothetical protein
MGYTTEFKGAFDLDAPLTLEQAGLLRMLAADEAEEEDWERFDRHPEGYFQWTVTKDRQHIVWDGNEKFYDYDEWLQWLIDGLLTAWGRTLSGQVEYQGESRDDWGLLKVVSGKVVKVERPTPAWNAIPAKDRKRALALLRQHIESGDWEDLEAEDIKVLRAALAVLEEARA